MIKIDARRFIRSMKAAQRRFPRLVLEAVQKSALYLRDHARASPLFNDRTGRLRRSILVLYANERSARVATAMKYAHWVERGNGPRGSRIYPKNGPYLRWTVGGQRFVANSVKAAAPRPFMATAAKVSKPLFVRLCNEAVKHMFR